MTTENKSGKRQRNYWKRLLNYQTIVKQIPFFLFLSFLAVVYIYNGHLADKTIRNINKTSNDLKELEYDFKSVKGDVLNRSRQSELIQAVKPLGLSELTVQPIILTDSSNK